MDEAGLSTKTLAEDLGEPASLIAAWRRGEAAPTAKQFHAMAKALHRPETFFFLAQPPRQDDVPVAFRSAPRARSGRGLTSKDAALIRTAKRAQRVSAWLVDQGTRPAAVLLDASTFDPVDEVAKRLRAWLGWEGSSPSRSTDAEFARRARADLENRGLLVLHTSMGPDGWRGFSLKSAKVPAVVASTHYSYRPRVFTYLHELVHLSTETESICAVDTHEDFERWCDQVASAVLMPAGDVQSFVREEMRLRSIETLEQVRRVANAFVASLRAAAVRLEYLGLAGPTLYDVVDSVAKVKEVRSGGGRGGEPQTTPRKRLQMLGRGYLAPLLNAETDHVLTRADTMELLDVTSTQLEELRALVATSALAEE
jgi:Zn-dependent peptidase ImmA (M78 family)/transcriptional regulator with XRE-family HTH domain